MKWRILLKIPVQFNLAACDVAHDLNCNLGFESNRGCCAAFFKWKLASTNSKRPFKVECTGEITTIAQQPAKSTFHRNQKRIQCDHISVVGICIGCAVDVYFYLFLVIACQVHSLYWHAFKSWFSVVWTNCCLFYAKCILFNSKMATETNRNTKKKIHI